jgi:prepilin-type N-terminal cleavage/methylation domain-containing protein
MNDRRGGFTLTELLVVMAAGSTLAMVAIGMVHRSFHFSSSSRKEAAQLQTFSRLAQQFRADARMATSASADSPGQIRMLIPGQGEVRYVAGESDCQRLIVAAETNDIAPVTERPASPEGTLARDEFRWLPGGRVTFMTEDEPRRVVLLWHRGHATGVTTGNQTAPAMEIAKPPVRVAAVIGSRASILAAPPKEGSP